MSSDAAKFHIGQCVCHKLFNYRGVIVDVDPEFSLTDDWYEFMARSRPPKDKPWYHVLVHNAVYATYVAENNLIPDKTGEAILHPDIKQHFDYFKAGVYSHKQKQN